MTSLPKSAQCEKAFNGPPAVPRDFSPQMARLMKSGGGMQPPRPSAVASSASHDEPVVLVTIYRNGKPRRELMAWRCAFRKF